MSEILHDPETEVRTNFEYYDSLLADINQTHPQKQGMTAEEFGAAMVNPEVVLSEAVLPNGERHQIPQLSPVEQFQWLNTDYYYKKYPVEANMGALMHYADYEAVEPSEGVLESVRDLAAKDGLLVFDYAAEADPAYPDRVKAMLDKAGVEVSEVEILGTQTYFAGQVLLKREHEELTEHLDLIPSFQKIVENGSYDVSRLHNGASLKQVVEENQATHMNKFYDEAFQVLNDHPCRQGLSPDEFNNIVVNDDEIAKIVNTKDGQITALCILGNDLSKFDWVNPDYYKQKFANKTQGQIVYFPALAADPKYVGANTVSMVGLIAELDEAGDNEMIVAFDCCDINTGFLDVALNSIINGTPQASIDIQPVASQRYCAIKLNSKP